MIGTLLAFFAVGLVALLVAGAVLSIVGILFSMTFSLKAAPVLLVGWVAVKIFAKMTGGGSLSAADRKWLGE